MTQFQLIDGNLNLRSPKDWMRREEVTRVPVSIGIIGPQGGGKSTLLNKCFGSNFVVLANEVIPERTTTGVWLATAKDPPTLLVDVEGADAVVHAQAQLVTGEHYQNAERKMALMSMVVADGLIINISHQDISKASPFVLFKTILELKLALFESDKTNLLFLVRDFPKMSDEDVKNGCLHEGVRKIVDERVAKMWKTIGEGKNFTDLFNLSYMAMPDLTSEQCIQGTNVPRRDAASKNIMKWRNTVAASKTRPEWSKEPWLGFLDGVWNTISRNSRLNLPAEMDLMFRFEFDRLTEAAFQNFEGQISTCNSLERIMEITEQLLNNLHAKTKGFKWKQLQSAYNQVENRVDITVTPVLERCGRILAEEMAGKLVAALRGIPLEQIGAARARQKELLDRQLQDRFQKFEIVFPWQVPVI